MLETAEFIIDIGLLLSLLGKVDTFLAGVHGGILENGFCGKT